jgi:starch synthase (maltosyl-transferring)
MGRLLHAATPAAPQPPSSAARVDPRERATTGGPVAADAIYYLHALLAGPIAEWDTHFARVGGMGFAMVALSPPFAPGAGGDVFAPADYDRLHPQLGGGDAAAALARIVDRAAAHGLSVLLDLPLVRAAPDARLAQAHPDWFHRESMSDGTVAFRFASPPEGLHDWWAATLAAWCEAGLAGFRCEAAHDVPPHIWSRLIAAVRGRHATARFLAFTHGASPDAIAGLVGCGFDAGSSSSCWWDFRSAWLDDDAARVAALGKVLALPEPLFGTRAAATGDDAVAAQRAARRALQLAAHYGHAWMMPMGFEFGASAPLDRAGGDAGAFAALAARPAFDLTAAVAAANALRGAEADLFAGPAARQLAVPGERVAVLARETGFVLALNPALDRPAPLPTSSVLPALGGAGRALAALGESDAAPLAAGATLQLGPGEAQALRVVAIEPIRRPDAAGAPAEDAAMAPRIAIEAIQPSVEEGRFPAKCIAGERLAVEADLIADGHGRVAADLLWRAADATAWQREPMVPLGNDRYTAGFPVPRVGRYFFTIEAWLDVFATFADDTMRKYAANVPIALDLDEGLALLRAAAGRGSAHAATLAEVAAAAARAGPDERLALLTRTETLALMRDADRPFRTRHEPALPVEAERPAAGFASWYELFPRSQAEPPTRHGTFLDVIARLPAIRAMGFDVLYFPPIHPIGRRHRKGRNNALVAAPDDPGSPYAIGAEEGGHDGVHTELGTLEDFQCLRAAAEKEGFEIALDFAVQCAPDHPWVREHPEWFDWRSDGSLRYAENPPKRYEDIVNVSFYAPGAVPGLWTALRDVVRFWLDQGVRTFRVDNPHTKPLSFWQWLIEDIRARDPDAVFLSEAFTRPKLMYRLAKLGFSQSYTYFIWRNTKQELESYFTELASAPVADFFRPHLFVNTPDINPLFLQHSGRAGFLIRAALATTLSGLWGMYNGFELCEARALPGREEYLDSEKYQLRAWDWDRPGNIIAEIARLNHIRRGNPALQSHRGTEFLNAFDDRVLYYARGAGGGVNTLLVAVNLDPQSAVDVDIEIPLWRFGLEDDASLLAEDLMRAEPVVWHGKRQRIRLDPEDLPFRIWRLDGPIGGHG